MRQKLLIILLTISISGFSQSEYYDALALRDLKPTLDSTSVVFHAGIHLQAAKILQKYTRVASGASYAEIFKEFSGNPFIELFNDKAQSSSDKIKSIKGVAGKIGGLDVTTVADGIARFLVERTKQELNIYFFDQFNAYLNDADYGKDLQKLFPNTHSVLLVAKDNMYEYQQYLQSFREAFAQDLAALLVNTQTWINQDTAQTGQAFKVLKRIQKSDIYPYLQFGLQIAVDLDNGMHPGDILNDISDEKFLNVINVKVPGFASTVKTANILSQSLRANDGVSYWIDAASFNAFKDETFTRIYLGLLYQKFKLEPDIKFNGQSFYEILAVLAPDVSKSYGFFNSFHALVKDTEQIISQLKNDTGNTQSYVSLLNNVMELTALPHTFFPDKVPAVKFIDDAVYVMNHTNNLMADLRARSYSGAVVEFTVILKKLNIGNEKFTAGFLKYGMFMANVASAKTAEEVQQAIEVVALPPGSYQVKRESRKNISINGYVGLYGGGEYLPASENDTRFSAGVFAPVGVAFSTGGYKATSPAKGGWSRSLFISLIDVGALASFRFGDNSTSVSSTIKLRDIIAPGLYWVAGLKRSPVSFGLGAQLGPNLREIEAGTAAIDEDYYVRFGAFVAVDIAIFTLYNKKEEE